MEFSAWRINDFTQELSGKAPVPGGGGASALAGAIGLALGNMVASLTIGKKKYADVEDYLIDMKERAIQVQERLLDLIQEDADGFSPLAEAYRMPKDTDEEKIAREDAIQEGLEKACEVPMEIIENCCHAIEFTEEFAVKGSRLAISDAGVSATLLRAALEGAALNVYINTGMMKDRGLADNINEKAERMLSEYTVRAEELYEAVKKHL